jgi:hypothetical protein
MIAWHKLTDKPSALALYTYGIGKHRRRSREIQDKYGKSKRNAKRRGIFFSLTPEHYAAIWRDDCALCGTHFLVACGEKEPRWNCRSLDRIDASKGYVDGNVRFTCYGCNVSIGLDNIARARRKEAHECYKPWLPGDAESEAI